jgi:basic membrane protein A
VYFLAENERDNAFVSAALKGAERAKEELGTDFISHRIARELNMQPSTMQDALEKHARKGFNPIIAIGHQNTLPVQNLSAQYPNTRFIVIDGLIPPLYSNVQSITFRDHEGAFLVGYIAASVSKTAHIGFIGGMDIPLIRNFAFGYEQGAKLANASIRIDTDYIGDTPKAWGQPKKGFALARKQYESGADVIFGAAGGSGVGILRASESFDKLSIGVDTNQNALYPGHVLTSLIKRVDIAVFTALKQCRDDTWKPGITMLGVRDGALDFALDEHNKDLIGEKLLDKVSGVRERILNGIINVDSYTVR